MNRIFPQPPSTTAFETPGQGGGRRGSACVFGGSNQDVALMPRASRKSVSLLTPTSKFDYEMLPKNGPLQRRSADAMTAIDLEQRSSPTTESEMVFIPGKGTFVDRRDMAPRSIQSRKYTPKTGSAAHVGNRIDMQSPTACIFQAETESERLELLDQMSKSEKKRSFQNRKDKKTATNKSLATTLHTESSKLGSADGGHRATVADQSTHSGDEQIDQALQTLIEHDEEEEDQSFKRYPLKQRESGNFEVVFSSTPKGGELPFPSLRRMGDRRWSQQHEQQPIAFRRPVRVRPSRERTRRIEEKTETATEYIRPESRWTEGGSVTSADNGDAMFSSLSRQALEIPGQIDEETATTSAGIEGQQQQLAATPSVGRRALQSSPTPSEEVSYPTRPTDQFASTRRHGSQEYRPSMRWSDAGVLRSEVKQIFNDLCASDAKLHAIKPSLNPSFKSNALEDFYRGWQETYSIKTVFIFVAKIVLSVFLLWMTSQSMINWSFSAVVHLEPLWLWSSLALRYVACALFIVGLPFCSLKSRRMESDQRRSRRISTLQDVSWATGICLWILGFCLEILAGRKLKHYCYMSSSYPQAWEIVVGDSDLWREYFTSNATISESLCSLNISVLMSRQIYSTAVALILFSGFILPHFKSAKVTLATCIGLFCIGIGTLVGVQHSETDLDVEQTLYDEGMIRPFMFAATIVMFCAIFIVAVGMSIGSELVRRREFYLLLMVASEKFHSRLRRDNDKESQLLKKNAFISNISHELRTPLQGVIGVIDLLRQTHLTAGQREYVSIAAKCIDSIYSITNDILDLERLDAQKMELNETDFDIVESFETEMANFFSPAYDSQLELVSSVSMQGSDTFHALPTLLRGDERRFTQILRNLMSNAIKYSRNGCVFAGLTVAVTSSATSTEAHNFSKDANESRTLLAVQSRLRNRSGSDDIFSEEAALLRPANPDVLITLTVQDEGPGIHPKVLPSIFQRYEQHDRRETSEIKGLGLGLSLTGSLCRLMNGRITVRSGSGKGTTFTVAIPMQLAQQKFNDERKLRDELERSRQRSLSGDTSLSKVDGRNEDISPNNVIRTCKELVADICSAQKAAERLLRSQLDKSTASQRAVEDVTDSGAFNAQDEKMTREIEWEMAQELQGIVNKQKLGRSSLKLGRGLDAKDRQTMSSSSIRRPPPTVVVFSDNRFLTAAVSRMCQMVGLDAASYPSFYTTFSGRPERLAVISEEATEVDSSEGVSRLRSILEKHQHESSILFLDEIQRQGCLAELFGEIDLNDAERRLRRSRLLSNRCDIGALRRLFSGYSCILLCHNKSMTYENLWRGISHTHCQFAMKPFRTVAVLRALNVLLRNGLQVARLEKIAATHEEKLASVDVSKRDLDNDLFYLTLKRPILVAAPKTTAQAPRRLLEENYRPEGKDLILVEHLQALGYEDIEIVHDGATALMMLLSNRDFLVAFIYEDLPAFSAEECVEAMRNAGTSTVVVKVGSDRKKSAHPSVSGNSVGPSSRVSSRDTPSMGDTPSPCWSKFGSRRTPGDGQPTLIEQIDPDEPRAGLKAILTHCGERLKERESMDFEAAGSAAEGDARLRSSVAEVLSLVERRRLNDSATAFELGTVKRRLTRVSRSSSGDAPSSDSPRGSTQRRLPQVATGSQRVFDRKEGRLDPLYEDGKEDPARAITEPDKVTTSSLGEHEDVPELSPRESPARVKLMKDVRCLLVEDDAITRKILLKVLKKIGVAKVEAAEDGLAALKLLRADNPPETAEFDIIFMDCQMPRMDGFECTMKIRELNWVYACVPIVATTAATDEDACSAVGMDGYLRKPVRREGLAGAIRHFLEIE